MRDSISKPKDHAAGHRPSNGAKNAEPSRRISATAAIERAKVQLYELTGQHPESVSSLSRSRDGWRIVLEIVELERIPRTTDILASYLVELDDAGELSHYARTHRYYRNEVGGEQ